MPAHRSDFADHALRQGIPQPLHREVQAVYAKLGEPVPMQRRHVSVALAPEAGVCALDGFDCRLCTARKEHDPALVAAQLANREQQWSLAAALKAAEGDAKALRALHAQREQLQDEEAQLHKRRAAVNERQGHSHCAHCGDVVPHGQYPALHAPAGFEGTPMRLAAVHCDRCRNSEHCSPDVTSPGSGLPDGMPGGFCQYEDRDVVLGAELLPGLHLALRGLGMLAKWAIGAGGLYLLSLGLVHSQGQQLADLEGTTGAIAVQDSTSGHGYNAGSVAFFDGSTPASANAAEIGTDLVDVTLPNPLMGVPAGFPSVATANAISPGTISNSGTATYGRIKVNGGTTGISTTERRLQITVGTSATDAIVNTTTFVAAGSLTITSFTYQHGS